MKPLMFFDERIQIGVHTATHARDVGRVMSIREFAPAGFVGVYQLSNGDLLVQTRTGEFIEGEEMR